MKLVNRCLLLLLLLGLVQREAWAQTCVSPPAPGGCTFVAIDEATGLTVEALCVGRRVRFEQCLGRNVAPSLLY